MTVVWEPEAADSGDQRPFERVLSTLADLAPLRRHVRQTATKLGLAQNRMQDWVLAIDEAATNAVVHGAGGHLRHYTALNVLICEISNRVGTIDVATSPTPPSTSQLNGRGMWLIQELCQRVDIRGGTIVLRINLPAAAPSKHHQPWPPGRG